VKKGLTVFEGRINRADKRRRRRLEIH
jgi:hypothetical protein